MAVIQKIRERYAKLAGAIIGLALVAFIVSLGVEGSVRDLISSNNRDVAKVNGQGIDGVKYQDLCKDYIALSELFRKGQPLTEQEQAQIRTQVLDQMINNEILEKECEKLGIVVTEAEQKDMVYGANADQTVQQFFATIFQAQSFDPRMVKQFEDQVKKDSDPRLQELGKQWQTLKKLMFSGKLAMKYNSMIAASAYTPNKLQLHNAKISDTRIGLRFVKLPLTLVQDAEAPVSDAEIKDYMSKHKAMYETDQPSRTLDYIVYDVTADAEDTAKALGVLQKLRPEFETATDYELFVNRNSEQRFANVYVNKNRFMSAMADTILKGSVGAVFGPFFENGSYKMVKVVDRRDIADSVKASHILIAINERVSDTVAHKRADSIYQAILAGANFDSLAVKFSMDSGSNMKGGDLGYFAYGTMVPEFNDAVFLGNKGELKQVKSQFGWHIIRINDQKAFSPAMKLATVVKSLNIGAKADQVQFAKANEFAGRNTTGEAFDASVKKEGLNKRVAEDIKAGDYAMPGLGSSREIIRWAYAAKVGDVSDPMHLENRYVVAKLVAINEPGLKSLDAATRTQVEGLVRAEKKAAILANKYKGASNLDVLAQQSGQTVQIADSLTGSSTFAPALGFEPKVIGYALNEKVQPNTVSPAIKGRDGVFFVSLMHREAPATAPDPQALKAAASMQDMQTRNFVQQASVQALRKTATIKIYPENIF